MNLNRTVSLSALALGLVGVLSACTVETAREYQMDPETQELAWAPGQGLIIDGLNGPIDVVQGQAGEVVVVFTPFTFRGSDEREEAEQEIADHLTRSIAEDAETGDIVVKTSADGGGSSIGARIEVRLPPEFDDAILVEQRNGSVELSDVARANWVSVTNDGAGDCIVRGAPSVLYTEVTCGFDIQVTGVADQVAIESTSSLESTVVRVELASVADDAPDSTIRTGAGEIALGMPSGASYTLTAQANDGGTVDLNDLDGGNCRSDEASAGSKSMSCGTDGVGPNFELVAGEDGSDTGNIEVRYF